jgi:hypothetical protein
MNRTEMKTHVQDNLMHGIGNVLGYWMNGHEPDGYADWSDADREAYQQIMQREADRVAKLFGYEAAWSN